MSPQVCQHCLQPVILARTEAHGRQFLLDPEPNPKGNQAAFTDPAGAWHTRQFGKDNPPYSFETVYMPHVATCEKQRPRPQQEQTKEVTAWPK